VTHTGGEATQVITGQMAHEMADDALQDEALEHSPLATSPIAQAGLGVVAAALGAAALADASGLAIFGVKGVPGPGFFPVVLSVAIIALGMVLVVVSAVRAVRHGLGPAGQIRGQRAQLARAGYIWAGFLAGIVAMPLIGFVPATVLLIAYLVIIVERIRGFKAAAVILVVPVLIYALFVFVLAVELPASSLIDGL
jgi:putative tricarboxylic transport membrane protein